MEGDQSEQDRVWFDEFLRELNRGETNLELTAEFADLVQQVMLTGKAGKMAVTVKVAPAGGRKVEVALQAKSTLPDPDPELALFYVGDGGSLHRNDPLQGTLDLGRVSEDTGPVRRLRPVDDGTPRPIGEEYGSDGPPRIPEGDGQ